MYIFVRKLIQLKCLDLTSVQLLFTKAKVNPFYLVSFVVGVGFRHCPHCVLGMLCADLPHLKVKLVRVMEVSKSVMSPLGHKPYSLSTNQTLSSCPRQQQPSLLPGLTQAPLLVPCQLTRLPRASRSL